MSAPGVEMRAATARRIVEAMVRALNSGEITIRTAAPTADEQGLGLETYVLSDVVLSQAVVRERDGVPRTWEVFLAAAEVESKFGPDVEQALAELKAAVGVSLQGRMLRVLEASSRECGGRAYLYRLVLGE